MKIYISHSSNYDYKNELYEPLREALKDHEVFFPHDQKNQDMSAKDILKECSLLIAEVSLPSTGQGIELGLASCLNIPIICFYKTGSKPSSSLKFLTNKITEYQNTEELTKKIYAAINADQI